jgi:mRNA interferase RelE/StbE
MKYSILFAKSAMMELTKLPEVDVSRIVEKIDLLADNPRPAGSKKLKGSFQMYWRIRVGEYRVVYSIEDVIRIIEIIAIRNRKDLY